MLCILLLQAGRRQLIRAPASNQKCCTDEKGESHEYHTLHQYIAGAVRCFSVSHTHSFPAALPHRKGCSQQLFSEGFNPEHSPSGQRCSSVGA